MKYEWEIRDKLDVNGVLSTIFHPNLVLYLRKLGLKDIKDLRIELADSEHGCIIRFYGQ